MAKQSRCSVKMVSVRCDVAHRPKEFSRSKEQEVTCGTCSAPQLSNTQDARRDRYWRSMTRAKTSLKKVSTGMSYPPYPQTSNNSSHHDRDISRCRHSPVANPPLQKRDFISRGRHLQAFFNALKHPNLTVFLTRVGSMFIVATWVCLKMREPQVCYCIKIHGNCGFVWIQTALGRFSISQRKLKKSVSGAEGDTHLQQCRHHSKPANKHTATGETVPTNRNRSNRDSW